MATVTLELEEYNNLLTMIKELESKLETEISNRKSIHVFNSEVNNALYKAYDSLVRNELKANPSGGYVHGSVKFGSLDNYKVARKFLEIIDIYTDNYKKYELINLEDAERKIELIILDKYDKQLEEYKKNYDEKVSKLENSYKISLLQKQGEIDKRDDKIRDCILENKELQEEINRLKQIDIDALQANFNDILQSHTNLWNRIQEYERKSLIKKIYQAFKEI